MVAIAPKIHLAAVPGVRVAVGKRGGACGDAGPVDARRLGVFGVSAGYGAATACRVDGEILFASVGPGTIAVPESKVAGRHGARSCHTRGDGVRRLARGTSVRCAPEARVGDRDARTIARLEAVCAGEAAARILSRTGRFFARRAGSRRLRGIGPDPDALRSLGPVERRGVVVEKSVAAGPRDQDPDGTCDRRVHARSRYKRRTNSRRRCVATRDSSPLAPFAWTALCSAETVARSGTRAGRRR